MPPCLHQKGVYQCLAQKLGGLNSMKTSDKNKALAIMANLDWHIHAVLQNVFRHCLGGIGLQRFTQSSWYVNICDGNVMNLQDYSPDFNLKNQVDRWRI